MADNQPLFNRVSLYEQVAQRLLTRIQKENRPGDRLPSESALSKQLGVSVITLREALSVLAHRGCIERRHGSGTYVADPSASQWVAIVTNLDLSHPNLSYFHRRVAYLLRSLIAEAGLRVRIYSGVASGSPSVTKGADFPESVFEDLRLGMIRALIVLPTTGCELFAGTGLPLIGTNPALSYSVNVRANDFFPSALRHMAARGCRTAALLGWDHGVNTDPQWDQALAEHGMTTHPEWVCNHLDYSGLGAGWEAFHRLWDAHRKKPDCVIVSDDLLFREVSLAILSRRIDVPGRLKVFTHYNKGSRVILPFPCVIYEVDPDSHARELAGLCREALGPNPPPARHILLSVEVLEHGAHDPPVA